MRLSVMRKGHTDETQNFEFAKESLTVGRDSHNDLQLPSNAVSASHAEIKKEPNGYSIIDLGSKNGVCVDEIKIVPFHKTELRPHTKIGIAHYEIEFTILDYSNEAQLEHFHYKPAETIVDGFTDDRGIYDKVGGLQHRMESNILDNSMLQEKVLNENVQEISSIEEKNIESLPGTDSMSGGARFSSQIYLYYLIAFLAVALGIMILVLMYKM